MVGSFRIVDESGKAGRDLLLHKRSVHIFIELFQRDHDWREPGNSSLLARSIQPINMDDLARGDPLAAGGAGVLISWMGIEEPIGGALAVLEFDALDDAVAGLVGVDIVGLDDLKLEGDGIISGDLHAN